MQTFFVLSRHIYSVSHNSIIQPFYLKYLIYGIYLLVGCMQYLQYSVTWWKVSCILSDAIYIIYFNRENCTASCLLLKKSKHTIWYYFKSYDYNLTPILVKQNISKSTKQEEHIIIYSSIPKIFSLNNSS